MNSQGFRMYIMDTLTTFHHITLLHHFSCGDKTESVGFLVCCSADSFFYALISEF